MSDLSNSQWVISRQFLLSQRMLQCLRQSVCTAQTSLIPKKSSPWHRSKVIRALCFTSGHSILNAEHSPNPGPTNHRVTFALKQRCSHCFLPLHCRAFLSKRVLICQLPVWKLQKTPIYCSYCATLGQILQPNPFVATCLLQKLSDFQEPQREPFIHL